MADTQVEKGFLVSDILVVRGFPNVLPEELPDVPPMRQVEFKIHLIPDARPIAKAPY